MTEKQIGVKPKWNQLNRDHLTKRKQLQVLSHYDEDIDTVLEMLYYMNMDECERRSMLVMAYSTVARFFEGDK